MLGQDFCEKHPSQLVLSNVTLSAGEPEPICSNVAQGPSENLKKWVPAITFVYHFEEVGACLAASYYFCVPF